MASPSHPHTQARVQPRNIYNHTYITFCLDKTKQSHTKSSQNNLHSIRARPSRIYEHSGQKIHNTALPIATHSKGYGSYLRPKTHIQHTHSHTAHTSTTSQYTHTNLYKSLKNSLQQDRVNRRRHSWLPTRQL